MKNYVEGIHRYEVSRVDVDKLSISSVVDSCTVSRIENVQENHGKRPSSGKFEGDGVVICRCGRPGELKSIPPNSGLLSL